MVINETRTLLKLAKSLEGNSQFLSMQALKTAGGLESPEQEAHRRLVTAEMQTVIINWAINNRVKVNGLQKLPDYNIARVLTFGSTAMGVVGPGKFN